MTTQGRAIQITANFERNLEEIPAFLIEQEASDSFDVLIDYLVEVVFPNLSQFSELGRDFLERPPISIEGQARRNRLQDRAGKRQIREYIAADYLILYAVMSESIALLSIKHHRQLSFDLKGHWVPS